MSRFSAFLRYTLLLATFRYTLGFLQVDGRSSVSVPLRHLRARRQLQDDSDTVCYNGCFEGPVDSPHAAPLPVLLLKNGSQPLSLQSCYDAARSAKLSYFAIVNTTDCYGGNDMIVGWAPDTCPLDCASDGVAPFTCGGVDRSSVFSLGKCPTVSSQDQPPTSPALPPPAPPSSDDTVCYNGCFEGPVDSPHAAPLPVLLLSGSQPLLLQSCYDAARSAKLSYFAIVNTTDCYGGNDMMVGWAPDICPLDCAPDGVAPFTCGGVDRSSVFSLGKCLRVGDDQPPSQTSPPSPPPPPPTVSSPSKQPIGVATVPPPPSPDWTSEPPEAPGAEVSLPSPPQSTRSPPPPGPKIYKCRPGVALWGTNLPDTPVKLNPTKSTEFNRKACQDTCSQNPSCKGFYYKTTGWCYMLSKVYGFGKHYSTAVEACKVPITMR